MTDQTKQSLKRQLKELELEEKKTSLAKDKIDLELRQLDHKVRHLGHGAVTDAHAGTFRLETGVYQGVLELSSVMQRWATANPGLPVTLYIFSGGGSVFHGFVLYDTLRTLAAEGHAVTTVVRGFSGSMASVIFLAGDRRLIGAESLIHQHEGSSGVIGSASDINDEAAFMKKLEDKITRIYTSRTNLTASQFKAKIRRKDWYLEAAEAVELGIATEIG